MSVTKSQRFGPQIGASGGTQGTKSKTGGLHSTSPVNPIGRSVTACIVSDRTPGVVTGEDDKFARPPMTDDQWKTFCKLLLGNVSKLSVQGTVPLVSGVTTTPVMVHAYIPAGRQDQLRRLLEAIALNYRRDILVTFGTVELISSYIPATRAA